MPAVLCQLASLYVLVLFGRALLSWFPPPAPGSGMASVNRVVISLTEPILAPVRSLIPPMGGFDVSFIVVVFGLQIILRALGCGLGF